MLNAYLNDTVMRIRNGQSVPMPAMIAEKPFMFQPISAGGIMVLSNITITLSETDIQRSDLFRLPDGRVRPAAYIDTIQGGWSTYGTRLRLAALPTTYVVCTPDRIYDGEGTTETVAQGHEIACEEVQGEDAIIVAAGEALELDDRILSPFPGRVLSIEHPVGASVKRVKFERLSRPRKDT